MSEWCQNRFEITGKSVCIDVLLQWIMAQTRRVIATQFCRAYSCSRPGARGY